MKRARALDHWRHIADKPGQLSLREIQCSELRGFGTFDATLSESRLLVICGHNGAGKTTFSRLMQACLTETESGDPPAEVSRLDAGSITARGVYQGDQFSSTYRTSDASKSGYIFESATYVEPAHEVPALQRLVRTTIDIEEMRDAAGSNEVAVEDYCFAVGKRYERISFSEVELEGEIWPFFVVETSGGGYDSRNMGLGELSIFYMIWILSIADKGTLLFLEEPEVFISPRSQRAFADLLAKFCDQKDLYVISTTHSASLLEPIPNKCIRVFSNVGGDTKLLPVTNNEEHLAVLGMTAPQQGVVLVEDRAARALLGCILRKYSPDVAKRLPIVSRGSHGDVLNALNEIPRDLQPFTFLAVLDGDVRDQAIQSEWPVYFLPGVEAPDLQLRRFGEENVEKLAAETRVEEMQLRVSIEALQGEDFHDWTKELAKRLGLAEWDILTGLSNLVLESDEQVSEEARILAESVASEVV